MPVSLNPGQGESSSRLPELIVYSRQGCHLCEDMLAALASFQAELGYRYRVYDVDVDPALFEKYNSLVPVVTLQGRELMRYFFELATLKEALGQFDPNPPGVSA